MGLSAFKDLNNCHSLAPPRKSLVKGERFVRHDGTSDLNGETVARAARQTRKYSIARNVVSKSQFLTFEKKYWKTASVFPLPSTSHLL